MMVEIVKALVTGLAITVASVVVVGSALVLVFA
jgi:hypothetical protein